MSLNVIREIFNTKRLTITECLLCARHGSASFSENKGLSCSQQAHELGIVICVLSLQMRKLDREALTSHGHMAGKQGAAWCQIPLYCD